MTPEIRNSLVLMVMTLMQTTGDTLTRCCGEVGISYVTYLKTVKSLSAFQEMHDEAIGISEDILADRLIHIDTVISDPKMAAVISKNIHWYLARKRPAKYGDKITVQHETSRDKAIIARLIAAKNRALPPPNIEDAIEISAAPSDQEALVLLGLG